MVKPLLQNEKYLTIAIIATQRYNSSQFCQFLWSHPAPGLSDVTCEQ